MHLGGAGGVFQAVDEVGDAGEGQAVEHLLPAFLIRDDSRLPEDGQVVGNRGPAQAAAVNQIGDAFFRFAAEFPDDAEPGLRGEGAEDFHR